MLRGSFLLRGNSLIFQHGLLRPAHVRFGLLVSFLLGSVADFIYLSFVREAVYGKGSPGFAAAAWLEFVLGGSRAAN